MLATTENRIPAMKKIAIDNVRQLEKHVLKAPQTKIATDHLFHAGVYARTIMIPAETVLTGALIEIATVLMQHPSCDVNIIDKVGTNSRLRHIIVFDVIIITIRNALS